MSPIVFKNSQSNVKFIVTKIRRKSSCSSNVLTLIVHPKTAHTGISVTLFWHTELFHEVLVVNLVIFSIRSHRMSSDCSIQRWPLSTEGIQADGRPWSDLIQCKYELQLHCALQYWAYQCFNVFFVNNLFIIYGTYLSSNYVDYNFRFWNQIIWY